MRAEKCSDVPPTVAGNYWLVRRHSSEAEMARFDPEESEFMQWVISGEWESTKSLKSQGYQFGPRIPSLDELGELPGLIENYVALVRATEVGLMSARLVGDVGFAGLTDQMEAAAKAKIDAILGVADETDGQ